MEWRMEDIFKIINLYRQFPCLWDFKNPFYKKVDKRKRAWEEISKIMGKDEETVKKKMKNLRTAYLLEKKKVDSSKIKSGSSAKNVYTPHLFYYKEMKFLEASVTLRETTVNLNYLTRENKVTEFEPTLNTAEKYESPNDSSTSSKSDHKPVFKRRNVSNMKRKAMRDERINSALDAIIAQTSSEKETMYSSFGRSVGMQLEQMSLNSAMEAMVGIQKLLAEIFARKNKYNFESTRK